MSTTTTTPASTPSALATFENEFQVAETARVLQLRIEGVPAQLKILGQRGLPAIGVIGQFSAQHFAARLRLASIFLIPQISIRWE